MRRSDGWADGLGVLRLPMKAVTRIQTTTVGGRIMHTAEQTTNSNNHVVEMIIVGLINIIEIVENHQNI